MLFVPVRSNRLFAAKLKYSKVKWASLEAILTAFSQRICQWYLDPIRLHRDQPGQHGAFAALGVTCLLIDALCQYDSGKVTSNRKLFIDYIEDRLPHYKRAISPPIRVPRVDSQNCVYETVAATGAIRTRDVKSVAEGIYYIFRNGILHEAHAPLCGVITGLKRRRFSIRRSSLATYADTGLPCPVLVIDPWRLFADVERSFEELLNRVRAAGPSGAARLHFNVKFKSAFGIDISTAQ